MVIAEEITLLMSALGYHVLFAMSTTSHHLTSKLTAPLPRARVNCGKPVSVGVGFSEASSHSGSFSLPLTDARAVRSCVMSKWALSLFLPILTAKLSKVSESYNSSIVRKGTQWRPIRRRSIFTMERRGGKSLCSFEKMISVNQIYFSRQKFVWFSRVGCCSFIACQ